MLAVGYLPIFMPFYSALEEIFMSLFCLLKVQLNIP